MSLCFVLGFSFKKFLYVRTPLSSPARVYASISPAHQSKAATRSGVGLVELLGRTAGLLERPNLHDAVRNGAG